MGWRLGLGFEGAKRRDGRTVNIAAQVGRVWGIRCGTGTQSRPGLEKPGQ
jgi:hypothetical protein